MSKVVVTGGAGFIGSHLVDALLDKGYQVTVLDNLFSGKEENIAHVREKIEFILGDIRDYDVVKMAFRDAEYVLHQAAIASVPRSCADPVSTTTANVIGTMNVLMAAKENQVRRVVFAASSSAYGDTELCPQVETMYPMPVSPYAASKVAGELYLRVWTKAFGLETVSLRYFNVFGPRQDPNSEYAAVIPKFITSILSGERPVIFGTGRQSRDFCYIENVVNANLLAMKAKGAEGMVFNVGCGETHDLLELLDIVCEFLGKKAEPVFAPPRPGDVMKTYASIESAQKILGYKVLIDFREGLKRTVNWFVKRYSK